MIRVPGSELGIKKLKPKTLNEALRTKRSELLWWLEQGLTL